VSDGGGTHAYLRELVGGLAQRGRCSIIITRRSDESLLPEEQWGPLARLVRVTIGPAGPLPKEHLNGFHVESMVAVRQIADGLRACPVLLHSVYWNSGRVAMDLARERSIPFVHTVISNGARRRLEGATCTVPEREEIEGRVYRTALRVLCVSNEERDDLVTLYHVDPARTIVVGRVVDEAFLSPAHDELGRPRPLSRPSLMLCADGGPRQPVAPAAGLGILDHAQGAAGPRPRPVASIGLGIERRHWWSERAIVYAGRLATDKGLEAIVGAWLSLAGEADLACPPLWLVGGLPEEADRVRLSTDVMRLAGYERSGSVMWWGYLDAAGLSAVLTRALVLVTHSRYEPGGRVILEAMAEGVPVIATPHGFARELVRDWRNGFLVPFGGNELLRRRLRHFIAQPLLRQVLGECARATAAAALNRWRFLDTHCEVYDSAVHAPDVVARSGLGSLPEIERCDYFQRRQLPSVYPFSASQPTAAVVRCFLERTLNADVQSLQTDTSDGTSLRWVAKCRGESWLVKWAYPRLSTRAIWDPTHREPLVHTTAQRFATDELSGRQPGCAPWTASDAEEGLLVRPLLRTERDLPPDAVFRAGLGALENLYRVPVAWQPPVDVAADWDAMGAAALRELLGLLRRSLVEGSPAWDPYRHTSLRVGWRRALLSLSSVSAEVAQLIGRSVGPFLDLARRENALSIVICHGSAEVRHVAWLASGAPVLLDGEHLHPGWPGEDLAALLLSLDSNAVSESLGPARECLASLSSRPTPSTRIEVIVSWMGLLTLENLLREHTFAIDGAATAILMQRWHVLSAWARTLA
jgi:glycosyltransferase involved in cell wall biosynthesis